MGKGKQRIEMKRIVDKSKRRVTFSKRRQGLFKKALELDTLCGSSTSVVSVSDAGTVFTSGSIHPSLVHQLLALMAPEAMGSEELGTVLESLKKARESVELLLLEKEKEEEEEAAAAAADGFSDKDPNFADGATITATPSSLVSSFDYGCSDFEGIISGYFEIEDFLIAEDGSGEFGIADIEDILMRGDGFHDVPSSATPGSEEELNSFESELMRLL